MHFEKVNRVAGDPGIQLPVRATAAAAGYDFMVAEDTIIPSYFKLMNLMRDVAVKEPLTFNEVSAITKQRNIKPTLVPTGIKAILDEDHYLELSVRSSCPLKSWLILANGVGVIDADYANNPDNDGEIFFQLINLSPFDIQLHRGDKIGQGIIKPYCMVANDQASAARTGGFGSTTDFHIDTTSIIQSLKELPEI